MDNKKEDTTDIKETVFENPNPWNKIEYFTHINKYFIQIKNINNHVEKIMVWKSLPIIKTDLIDIDIDNNYLILKTDSEEEALVICNLMINYINNNITIDDIISKNLIKYSINKAKKYKLINAKLIELIKEGQMQLNNEHYNNFSSDYIDTNDMTEDRKKEIIDKIKMKDFNKKDSAKLESMNSNTIKEVKSPFDNIIPYEGSEYASIQF